MEEGEGGGKVNTFSSFPLTHVAPKSRSNCGFRVVVAHQCLCFRGECEISKGVSMEDLGHFRRRRRRFERNELENFDYFDLIFLL